MAPSQSPAPGRNLQEGEEETQLLRATGSAAAAAAAAAEVIHITDTSNRALFINVYNQMVCMVYRVALYIIISVFK